MNAPAVTTSDAREGDRRGDRRNPAALVVAGVIAVTVVVLVLLLGVARPPALPRVGDDPSTEAPGELAMLRHDGGDACVVTVAPDGTSRSLWCSDGAHEVVAWDERGIVVRSYASAAELEVVVDPDSGQVRSSERVPVGQRWQPATENEPLTTSRTPLSPVLEVRSGDGTVLWRVDAPEAYDVTAAWSTPDPDTLLLRDTAGRLLLVPADGSAAPRIWVEDVATWGEVVWRDGDLTSRG